MIARVRTDSFRHRIRNANICMTFIVLFFLLIFNLVNFNVKEKYNAAFESYNELSLYFKNLDEADAGLKDYLYTESEESFAAFQAYMEKANQNIRLLQENHDIKDYWRFDLLQHMTQEHLNLCESTAQAYAEGNADYLKQYNQIQHTQYLIDNTASSYYTLITDSMSEQSMQLEKMHFATLLGTAVLIIVLLAWLLYYSHQIMTSITRPVDSLLHNIGRIKVGEYDLTQIAGCGQEMEELCVALNDMAKQVQKNIENTKEKGELEKQLLAQENENLRKDELLAQSELKMLQNQINPHFLFNTLNMIHRLVLLGQTQTASRMILKTSQLLRYGLDMQNKISNLKNEIEAISSYIDIQKLRLGNRVEFLVHVDQTLPLEQIQIPGMILQPLVENAIKHGLNNVMKDGEVEVYIAQEKNQIVLSVSDNGEGMDRQDLDAFIQRGYQKSEGDHHLGLYNVIRRLEMFYRDDIKIELESDRNCGFSFTAMICNDHLFHQLERKDFHV